MLIQRNCTNSRHARTRTKTLVIQLWGLEQPSRGKWIDATFFPLPPFPPCIGTAFTCQRGNGSSTLATFLLDENPLNPGQGLHAMSYKWTFFLDSTFCNVSAATYIWLQSTVLYLPLCQSEGQDHYRLQRTPSSKVV